MQYNYTLKCSMTYLTLYDIAHAMALLHELSLLETVNAALTSQLERWYKGMFMFCSIPDNDLFNDINRITSDGFKNESVMQKRKLVIL